jgi:hypothetical protein
VVRRPQDERRQAGFDHCIGETCRARHSFAARDAQPENQLHRELVGEERAQQDDRKPPRDRLDEEVLQGVAGQPEKRHQQHQQDGKGDGQHAHAKQLAGGDLRGQRAHKRVGLGAGHPSSIGPEETPCGRRCDPWRPGILSRALLRGPSMSTKRARSQPTGRLMLHTT